MLGIIKSIYKVIKSIQKVITKEKYQDNKRRISQQR